MCDLYCKKEEEWLGGVGGGVPIFSPVMLSIFYINSKRRLCSLNAWSHKVSYKNCIDLFSLCTQYQVLVSRFSTSGTAAGTLSSLHVWHFVVCGVCERTTYLFSARRSEFVTGGCDGPSLPPVCSHGQIKKRNPPGFLLSLEKNVTPFPPFCTITTCSRYFATQERCFHPDN